MEQHPNKWVGYGFVLIWPVIAVLYVYYLAVDADPWSQIGGDRLTDLSILLWCLVETGYALTILAKPRAEWPNVFAHSQALRQTAVGLTLEFAAFAFFFLNMIYEGRHFWQKQGYWPPAAEAPIFGYILAACLVGTALTYAVMLRRKLRGAGAKAAE